MGKGGDMVGERWRGTREDGNRGTGGGDDGVWSRGEIGEGGDMGEGSGGVDE